MYQCTNLSHLVPLVLLGCDDEMMMNVPLQILKDLAWKRGSLKMSPWAGRSPFRSICISVPYSFHVTSLPAIRI